MLKYVYKRGTLNRYPITEIYFNKLLVGYFMPLYNKPEYKYTPANKKWYVNINTDDYFLIEDCNSKKEILSIIEKFFEII